MIIQKAPFGSLRLVNTFDFKTRFFKRITMRRNSSSFGVSRVKIDEKVQEALSQGRPVVALESTIIAHGMPYPENIELSKRVASILRSKGVEPATIAVKDGVCRVGLSMEELEDLARAGKEGRAQKCSTRELSLVLAQHETNTDLSQGHQWGATTVASTMTLAHRAGIPVFVTGGIGGVHRHGEVSMDVSADLTELGRCPVVVVSAGIKSILDIHRTLEVLETNGVPTLAYKADEFPAFFSPKSGVEAPSRVDDAMQVASAYWAARDLSLSHGMLVAVPNTDPAGANVEDAIQAALAEAEEQGIHGQSVTPFILKRVAEKTAGDSLRSNVALVERNASVGADIALAIAEKKRLREKGCGYDHIHCQPRSRVVVLGGIVLDIVARPKPGHHLVLGTSNPATCSESDGGVGRNVAEVLGRLGVKPLLYSSVGRDFRGLALLDHLEQCGVSCKSSVCLINGANTATYLAVLNGEGDLHTACADMDVFSKIEAPPTEVIEEAEVLVLDANPLLHVSREAAQRACGAGVKVFFEPTSVSKASIAAGDEMLLSCLTCAFPNSDELVAMADRISGTSTASQARSQTGLEELKELSSLVLAKMNPNGAFLVVTMGEDGVLLVSRESSSDVTTFRHFPANSVHVRNTSGAGDSLCGAFIHAFLNGKSIEEAVCIGIDAASLSLKTVDRAISPQLSDKDTFRTS